ncbi:DNA polymerase IV [hydrothermal vent metagenome]|uniref:DNA-directed DNA polymerase n=1 Tax=hydrothermal vent metagenome TaxID=652676 RepID=A0A3B0WSI8_9ZZZZ
MNRKIIHIDMDAFFAAVEQRDFPELKGKPVIVGGQPDSRGVVAASSYEARKFGIYSAMPCSRAYKLCPQAVFVPPRFSAYKHVSKEIHKVFHEYTSSIEPLSLDEAYLDVTHSNLYEGSASLMAKEIREKIFERIHLTASAGISYNKFLAKLGSDQNKPNGQFIIKPGEAEHYLHNLPIGRFYGVGKVTEAKMKTHGINTGGDLKNKNLLELQKLFGNSAEYYYDISRGIDHRAVSSHRIRKSLGSETTFQQDMSNTEEMLQQLFKLLDEVLTSLEKQKLLAHTLTIKVKYANFTQITRSHTSDTIISTRDNAIKMIPVLLAKTEVDSNHVRLLGISFSNLLKQRDFISSNQLPLF